MGLGCRPKRSLPGGSAGSGRARGRPPRTPILSHDGLGWGRELPLSDRTPPTGGIPDPWSHLRTTTAHWRLSPP